jgi:hypothetical protein
VPGSLILDDPIAVAVVADRQQRGRSTGIW